MLVPKRISVRNKKGNLELGMVVPNTQEVEEPCEFKANLESEFQKSHGHTVRPCQKKKKRTKDKIKF